MNQPLLPSSKLTALECVGLPNDYDPQFTDDSPEDLQGLAEWRDHEMPIMEIDHVEMALRANYRKAKQQLEDFTLNRSSAIHEIGREVALDVATMPLEI